MDSETLKKANSLSAQVRYFKNMLAAISDPSIPLRELFEDYPEAATESDAAKVFRNALIDDYSRNLERVEKEFESL